MAPPDPPKNPNPDFSQVFQKEIGWSHGQKIGQNEQGDQKSDGKVRGTGGGGCRYVGGDSI